MKIAFVSYHYWPPHFGGELLLSIERFQTLAARGHQIIILTSGVPGFPAEETNDNYKIYRSPIFADSKIGRGIRRLYFLIWAVWKMRKLDLDIIHHGGTGGITANLGWWGILLINKLIHKKGLKSVFVNSLADSEANPFEITGKRNNSKNKAIQSCDALISVSPAIHKFAAEHFPLKSKMILNGIRDDIFTPITDTERASIRNKHGAGSEEAVFSFLGTVTTRKGFDLLAQAFIKFVEKYPQSRLWLIGPLNETENQNFDDDTARIYLKELKKLGNKVVFFGRINDREKLAKIIAASDVFLFPTRREGMPLAPMEAMASGTPIVISKIPGVTDLANVDGSTGIFIDVGDVDGLLGAMVKLSQDKELRLKMGINARTRVVGSFGWKTHVDNWEKLYQDLFEKRG